MAKIPKPDIPAVMSRLPVGGPEAAAVVKLAEELFGPIPMPTGTVVGPARPENVELMQKYLGVLMKRMGKYIKISSVDPTRNRVIVHEVSAPTYRWQTTVDELGDSIERGITREVQFDELPEETWMRYMGASPGAPGVPVTTKKVPSLPINGPQGTRVPHVVKPKAPKTPKTAPEAPPEPEKLDIKAMLEASLKQRSGK